MIANKISVERPISLSIRTLLTGQKYIVPLYQRNYAWRYQEIRQFLEDINNMAEGRSDSSYYIGTLVVDTAKNGELEIIDGQQRFSTLTVIMAVLKARGHLIGSAQDASMITFDARDEVTSYLNLLFTDYDQAKAFEDKNLEVGNWKFAVRYVEEFFCEIRDKAVEIFASYLYEKVKIIRIAVPPGTDINHYFEIMNNRGEQLEKHEILKAKFISNLPNDKELRKRFADIWDACSQMNRHVIASLGTDLRINIGGENFDKIPTNFFQGEFESGDTENPGTLETILEFSDRPVNRPSENIEELPNRFRSIIDFPGFLLQVLKLEFDPDVSLDDKRLLDEFGYSNKKSRSFPASIEFLNALLRHRLLFDRYVIKREEGNNDWTWNLSKPKKGANNDLYFVNTFGVDDSEGEEKGNHKEMVMLQAMLHVSFPGNNYKEWLQALLKCLKSNGVETEFPALRDSLFNYSGIHFEKSIEVGWFRGVGTQRFVFNYLDFKLWLNRDSYDLSDKGREKFTKFRFTQNNSIEHMHPQNHVNDLAASTDSDFESNKRTLDYFGNLCLISKRSNSRYSDLNFEAKKGYYLEHSSVESLKQVLMFEHSQWNTEEIIKHGKKMIEIIKA